MMKSIGISGLCLVLLAASAHAADLNAGRALVLKGNGQGAIACQTCHGVDGAGNAAAGFPRLAGLNPEQLAKQLHDFQQGTRKDPTMQPIAKGLSESEMANVAAYYATQHPTVTPALSDQALIARGEHLALSGLWDKNIPACVSCHGPSGHGVGTHFPALAGQHASYITRQFEAWRNGTRANDPQALMKGIAERLPQGDIAAVSAYFASLPPAK